MRISWLRKLFGKLGLASDRKRQPFVHARFRLELLEDRINPNTALSLTGTVLTMNVDAGETATLSIVAGNEIQVSDAGHNVTANAGAHTTLGFALTNANTNTSIDPPGLAADTTNVTAIVVTGGGTVALGGANVLNSGWGFTVDASGGTAGTFDLAGFAQQVASVTGTGTVTDSGAAANFTVANTAADSFAGKVTGSTRLVVAGTGTLTLTNAGNTYAGSTTVNANATLADGVVNALPTATALIVNGTFDLAGFAQQVASVTGTGTVTDSGAAANFTVANTAADSFAGTITGSTRLVVAGTDTLSLTNAGNTYTGSTTVNANATLADGIANALPTATALIVNGTFDLSGFAQQVASVTGTGTVTDTGAAANFTVANTAADSFAGTITGSTRLVVAGTGTLTLTNAGITYTGSTTVNANATLADGVANALPTATALIVNGTFDLSGFAQQVASVTGTGTVTDSGAAANFTVANTAADSFAGTITGSTRLVVAGTDTLSLTNAGNAYTGSTTVNANATLADGVANALPTATALIVNGTFDLSGFAQQVASVTGTGTVTDTGAAANFTVANTAADSFAGTITGSTRLLVAGTNTLTLTNAVNTYTGSTTVNANATLADGVANALPTGTALIVNGTFDLAGFAQQVASVTGTGTVTSATATTFTVNVAAGTDAFSGTIDGANLALTKLGAGTLDLGGANVIVTDVTISAGILKAPAAGNTFDVTGDWANSAGAAGFSANGGTVTFDGATQSLTSGGASFASLAHNATGKLTGLDTLTLAGNFTNTANDLDITSRTVNVAGNWLWSAGTLTSTGSTVVFNGATQSVTSGGQSFNNLTHNATGTLTAADPLTLTGNFTNTANNLDITNKTVNIAGNWSWTAGTLTTTGSTVVFNGVTQSVTSGGQSFNNLTHNATGKLTVLDTLTLAGNFTNTANDLDITSRTVNVAGNWLWSAGTLTSTGSTVVFNGAAQSLTSGGQSFNNLTHNGAGTLTLQDALTVGGALDIEAGAIDLSGQNLSVTGAVTNKGTIELPGTNTETVTLTSGNDTAEGTWLYYGDNTAGPITIRDFGANDYFNLTINDTNATPAVYQPGAALHVAGTLTVSAGTLNLSSQTVTGNVTVNSSGILKGNGTIAGNVAGTGTFAPGNSPGTITINGNFTPSGTVVFDVNSPYVTAGSDYDQFIVSGTVNLSAATLSFNGTATAAAANTVVTLIKNNSGTTTTASANPANVTLIPTIDGGLFKIFYTGGFSGDDVVLVDTTTPAVVYVSPTFTGAAGMQVDGDLGTAGVQTATIGINAFASISAAIAAVTASGQVIVNAGTYAEAASLNGTKTLTVTSAAAVAVNSLASIAGTTIQINGTSLTDGDATSTTVAGTLTGAGQLVKQGTGQWTLSGTNSYTGTTTINVGTLQVTTSLTNSASVVNLNGANAVLDGAGTGQILRPIVVTATGSGAQVTNLTAKTMTTTLDGITVQSGANNVTLSNDAITGNRNGINANAVSSLQLTSVNVTGATADGFLGTGLTGTTTINGTSHFDTNARGMQLSGGGGTVSVTGATFSSNTVAGSGAGIDIGAGTGSVNLTNSTIASNTATVAGGGISVETGYANTLTLTGTTVGGAVAANKNTAASGGGISVASGTVTLNSAIVSNNTASANGGGISVTGGIVNIEADTTLAASSQIVSNAATTSGGGINVSGGAVNFIENLPNVLIGAVSFFNAVPAALVQNNTATNGNGGGFNVSGGSLSLNVATVSGNLSGLGNGGGLNASAGAVTLANSTFTANTAKTNGGGGIAFSGTTSPASITNVTVSGNSAGNGVEVGGGTVNLINDTIANNTGGGVKRTAGIVNAINTVFADNPTFDFSGAVASQGHNLFQTNTGTTGTTSTDLLNEKALLAALANYGGPTATQTLLPGSAALNSGATTAAATDARGVARPVGGVYDIGAVESLGFTVTRIATPDPTTVNETPAGDTKYRTLIDHNFMGTDGATPSIFAASVVANDPNLTNLTGGVLNFLTPAGTASAVASGAITNIAGNVVTSANHGLVTGQQVTITGVIGDTAANGTFTVTVTGVNTFTLNGVVSNGAYVSGGTFAATSPVGVVAGTTGSGTGPIVVTGFAHGFVTGQKVTIAGVTGNTAANGTFTVTVVDTNHFSLNGTTGNGAYAGGGTFVATNTGGAITAATNAGPIVITSANHGLATGEQIKISGVLGDTAADGVFTVTVLNANQFSLNGSVGNGVYQGGGSFTAVTTVSSRPVALTLSGGSFVAQTAIVANNTASTAGANYFLFATADANSYAANVANTSNNTDWKMFNQKVVTLANSGSPQNANSGNQLLFKSGAVTSPNFTVSMLDQEGSPVIIVGESVVSQASQAGVLAGWQSGPISFDSSAAVNETLANSITSLQFKGLVTGQSILYNVGTNPAIGGLTNLQTYYVLTTSRTDTIQLTAAPGGAAIALTPTAVSSQQSLTVLGNEVYNVFDPTAAGAVTTGVGGTLTSPQFAGLVNGQPVKYFNGGGTNIGGLLNGTTYFVKTTATPNTIQFTTDAAGLNLVTISSVGAGTQHGLMTLGGVGFTPSVINNVNHTITLPSMTFINGQAVVYHNGGGVSIPNLTDGATYYVVTVGNSNIIKLAAVPGGTPLPITSVGAGPLQLLAPAVAKATTTSAGVATFGNFLVDQSRGDAYTLQAVYTNPDGSSVAAAASSSSTFHVIPKTILVIDGNFTQLNTQQSTIVVAASDRGSVRLVQLNIGATGLAANSIKVEAFDFLSLTATVGAAPTPFGMILAASYNGPITLSANVPLLGNQGNYTMTQGILLATNITPSTSLGTFFLFADSAFNDAAGAVDVKSNGLSTTGAFIRTNPGRQRGR